MSVRSSSRTTALAVGLVATVAFLTGCQPKPTEPTTGSNNAPKSGTNAGVPANLQAPTSGNGPGGVPPRPPGTR